MGSGHGQGTPDALRPQGVRPGRRVQPRRHAPRLGGRGPERPALGGGDRPRAGHLPRPHRPRVRGGVPPRRPADPLRGLRRRGQGLGRPAEPAGRLSRAVLVGHRGCVQSRRPPRRHGVGRMANAPSGGEDHRRAEGAEEDDQGRHEVLGPGHGRGGPASRRSRRRARPSSLQQVTPTSPSPAPTAGGSRRSTRTNAPNDVRVIDADSGRVLFTLVGHTHSVTCIAFSPDGRRIATASHDRTVKLWDAETGLEVLTLRGHTAGVLCVAFSPDGHRLVSGSIDRTARVWDATPLAPGDLPTDSIYALRHHRSGRRLESAKNRLLPRKVRIGHDHRRFSRKTDDLGKKCMRSTRPASLI